MRRRCATVATPGEWQCGVRRLAVVNGPNIFRMLLVFYMLSVISADFDFVFLVLAERLAGKSVSNMTYFMSSRTLNFNAVYQSMTLGEVNFH